jgi:hypothetical protein
MYGNPIRRTNMIQRDERRSERFELRIRPSELAAIAALARVNDRSVAAEIRHALAAWVERNARAET